MTVDIIVVFVIDIMAVKEKSAEEISAVSAGFHWNYEISKRILTEISIILVS